MKFEKYESYIDNEIDWLDNIPIEWSVKRIKDLSKLESGSKLTSNDLDENSIYPAYGGGGFRGYTSEYTNDGDHLLIGRQGALCGNIKRATGKFWATEHSVVVYHKKNTNIEWYKYILEIMNLNQYSISSAQPGLSVERLTRLSLPYIDNKKQEIISNFLDIKTLKIDKEISILEQKIEKYKELRQTLIAETVLRGLDKNIELKDSEIEWIGNIPKHWEVKRLKDFIKFTIGGEVIDVSYWNDGNELTYTAGKNSVLSTFDNFPDRKRTKQNDILITRNGDGFIHVPKLNSIFTNVVQLVRLSKKTDVKFIFYALENIKYHINKTSNGDFIASLNKDMWFNSFIMIPKLVEQVEISNYLDEKTSKINSIVETIGKKIEVLKEFRKTLINDVVTGKVKVA